jgi:rSAM/selenodomain-associated transferase 2
VSLDIVMPTLNEAAGIVPTLQALAPLRSAGVQLIVVDGGSSDGTAALAAPWADRVIHTEPGRALQMNAGAAVGSAEQLLFLHADTTLPAHADWLVDSALANSARVWGRFDVQIVGRSRWLGVVSAMMNWRSRWSGIATGDQALFMQRSAFEAVGGYPLQPLMEDIELSRRLRRLSAPACVRSTVQTSGRRWDERGVWRTITLMWRLRWLYWRGVPPERLAVLYR